MAEKMSGGPSVQSIPRGSEWEERCRRFFATDPGWATVSSEYPPGSPYSWVRTPESPSPMPCGEIPLPDVRSVSALGERDRGELEWIYLVAGMAVLRGMVVAQCGLGYTSAKSLVLDLLDAQSSLVTLQALPPSPGIGIPRERTTQIELVRGRLHELFNAVLGQLSQVDRHARFSVRTEAQAEAMVDEYGAAEVTATMYGIDSDEAAEARSLRSDLVAALVQTPDWQNRALAVESRLEGAEYLLAGQKTIVRELAGPTATSWTDVRNHVETVEGQRLSALQQRDEMAAHVLQMRELLGRLRTFEMPEDLEMIHHSIMASPRSAETERVAQTCIDGRVNQTYGEMVTAHAARETELLAEVRALKGSCERLKAGREGLEKSLDWWKNSCEDRTKRLETTEKSRDNYRKSAVIAGIALVVELGILVAIASGLLHSA